jgi:type IV pilus assembly protein PilM
MFNLFGGKPKTCLGIDIGTSSIKVVQLKRSEGRYKLETYGELQTYGYLERLNDPFQTKNLQLLESQVAEMLGKIMKEAGITTKKVALSIPIFSSFISVVDLAPMSEKELSHALVFESKRYIPVSLDEVKIDWEVIDKQVADSKDLFKFRVLLVAVPKEVITKYLRIARNLGLEVLALELENFSYTRSLVGNDLSTTCVLDFGARSTSFTIVDKGFIQMSHSLDIAGTELTKALAHSMGIDFKRAEIYKKERGLDHKELEAGREIKEVILTLIDKIIFEIERAIASYESKTKRKVAKLILSGGSGNLFGLDEYLKNKLKIDIISGNPWAKVVYPSIIEPALKEIAPKFAVAVGLAMREI